MDGHISGKCVLSAVPRMVQKIPGNTQLFLSLDMHTAHSVWATTSTVGSRCRHRLKGKHTVKQVAFSMFIKRVVALLVKIVLVM